MNGTAGRTTKSYSQGNYSGSGLLSVRGVPGAAPTDTFAIASGEMAFTKSPTTFAPLGGTINVLDANGQ